MVVAVGSLSYFGWQITQQSIAGTDVVQVQETAQATAAGLKVGDAATLKTRAYDRESAANSQVAATLYVEEWNGQGGGVGDFQLIEDATAMSASAATSTATSVGAHLKVCSFDSTYYGNCDEVLVDKETKPISIDSFAHVGSGSTAVKLTLYDSGSALTVNNLTLGSGQTDALDYLRLEVNQSNKAFNFKMLAFDLGATNNITNIEAAGNLAFEGLSGASGSLTESSVVPRRLRSALDYVFIVDSAIMLHEWEVLKTSSLSFQAESGQNPYEDLTIYVIDESRFKSVQGATANRILVGVETDADSAADVGASDQTLTLSLN